MRKTPSLRIVILAALAIEKFVQHSFVTFALWTDLAGIRATLAHDYRFFMYSGFLVGVLFLIGAFLLFRLKARALRLLLALALFDLVGEFFAQGTVMIEITLSFAVAAGIVVLVLTSHDRLAGSP